MKGKIVVTDNGEIREVSYMSFRDGVQNAYAQFGYGSNGRTREEAVEEAKAAVKQQAREQE